MGPVVLGVELEHVLEQVERQPRLAGVDDLLDGLQRALDDVVDHALELLVVVLGQPTELRLFSGVLDRAQLLTQLLAADRVAGALDRPGDRGVELLLRLLGAALRVDARVERALLLLLEQPDLVARVIAGVA